MKALLKMDPNERLTAAEALRHPYFEGLHEFEQDKLGRTDLNKDVSKRPGVQVYTFFLKAIHCFWI